MKDCRPPKSPLAKGRRASGGNLRILRRACSFDFAMLEKGKSRGFTLIEILLALAVVAVTGLAVATALGGVAAQTYALEQRTVAHWVAENQLARTQLGRIGTDESFSVGRQTERVRMAGRSWRVSQSLTETVNPWLGRVEVEVYETTSGDEVGPVERLVGFVGRY